jgi:hypothetical protein
MLVLHFEHTVPKNRDSGLPMNCFSYVLRNPLYCFYQKYLRCLIFLIKHNYFSVKNEINLILKPLYLSNINFSFILPPNLQYSQKSRYKFRIYLIY